METDVVRPQSLTLADVAEQQAKGWPDHHPEHFCHECGIRNPAWYADSADFNEGGLARGRIVCPQCFIEGYERATGTVNVWRVARAQFGGEVDALIASEAKMRQDRDAALTEAAELRAAFGVVSREELDRIERETGKGHQPFIDAIRKLRSKR